MTHKRVLKAHETVKTMIGEKLLFYTMTTTVAPIFGATPYAGMAELADALDSGSSRGNSVEVQVLLSAPKGSITNW